MRARQGFGSRGAHNLLWRETPAHPAPFTSVAALQVRTSPMLLLALAFASGILFRSHWQPPQQLVAAACLLVLTGTWAAWRAPRMAWAAVLLAWAALGWTAALLEPTGAGNQLQGYADGLQREVQGRVISVRHLPAPPPSAEAEHNGQPPLDQENAWAAREPLPGARDVVTLQVSAIENVTPDLSQMVPVASAVQLTVFGKAGSSPHPPPCGATVLLTARLHLPQRYLDPGVWQYADALALQGVSTVGTAEAGRLRVLEKRGTSWPCRFATAQQWSAARIHALVSNPLLQHLPRVFQMTAADTAMLSAMLVGDRSELGKGLRTAFERTGSFHLFVVAGMHITLLLAALYGLLRWARLPRWLAALLALLLTTLYALLTGFGAPVQRALLMSAVYLLTMLAGRRRNALNALGSAALAMLIARPHDLFESGFQMTVLAVIAIAGLAVPLTGRTLLPWLRATRDIRSKRLDVGLQPRLAQFRVMLRWLGEELAQAPLEYASHTVELPATRQAHLQRLATVLPAYSTRAMLAVLELMAVTLVAEMVLALPMAAYFHRMTPFAAPANLLALPMVGLLMGCAIVTFVTSLLGPYIAALPAAATALLLHSITFVVGTISTLRGADVRVPGPLVLSIAFAVLLWAFALVLLRAGKRQWGWAGAALLPAALMLVLWPRRPSLFPGALEFTAIDVGQGDSLLVASPNRDTMLIDAGGPTGSPYVTDTAAFDVGEDVVSPYLWSRGLRRLDVLVLTHAHSDHIGGMAAVLRNFRPRELWLSVDADTPLYKNLIALARAGGTTIRHLTAGEQQTWSGTEIHVLYPPTTYQKHAEPTNDDSLVLHIAYGKATVMAEGDGEHAAEDFVAAGHPQPVTLLKVGHHGSNTSTSAAFLAAVRPRCAVISCGRGNHFGHPRGEVLQRLQAEHVYTARTDQAGAVQYLSHSDGSIQEHVLASNP